jgi:hypothetical protein
VESRYYEQNPGQYSFDPQNTSLTGLGIGILAAAALSISPALSDIPRAGAEVVRLAFRLGIYVDEVSSQLQNHELFSGTVSDSWAYVLPDVEADIVQKELNSIHTKAVSEKIESQNHEGLMSMASKHQRLAKYSSVQSVKLLLQSVDLLLV